MTIDDKTLLIRLSTGMYPVSLEQVRKQNPLQSFKAYPSEEQLAQLGYAVVALSDKPSGQVVKELAPELLNGQWRQRWLARDYTSEELIEFFPQLKKARLAAVENLKVCSLERGAQYLFPDNTTGRVQLRDGDRANLSGLRLRALGSKQAGTNEKFYFRVWEDVNKGPFSADEIIVMSDIAFEKYMLVLGICWQLKDAVKNATVYAELPPVPANLDAFGI